MASQQSQPEGATPLTDSERQGLRLPIFTHFELNRAEAANIASARSWLFLSGRRVRPETVVAESWLRGLHRRMYNDVWDWAGQYRTGDKNLGVPYWQIRIDMRDLISDTKTWLADSSESRFQHDELAIRFGYRLVVVHPFANGNGRWSRLSSDALAVGLGRRPFSWGRASLTQAGTVRRAYIGALQVADLRQDFGPLLAFARS